MAKLKFKNEHYRLKLTQEEIFALVSLLSVVEDTEQEGLNCAAMDIIDVINDFDMSLFYKMHEHIEFNLATANDIVTLKSEDVAIRFNEYPFE